MKRLNEKRLIDAVARLLALARERWPRTPPLSRLDFRFPRTGKAVGKVFLRPDGTITFQVTREAMARWPEETLAETLPHEVAHLVCRAEFPGARPHGRRWREICRALGGSGERSHGHPASAARRCRRYLYQTACGEQFWLGPVRHRRAQRGTVYYHRGRSLSYARRQRFE